ncbi:MAG: Ycf66 family protein [Elainellaceae cyanobacterium]
MVNIGFGWPSILGIVLALGGAGLYALRSMRPALARDQDIVFAAISLLCGGILFFQGWRLDPILQFAQTLSVASAVWFAYEAIRLRSIATEQAKRSTPVVDDERPVSRVYRAELDDYPPIDERERFPVNRRIRGSRDVRPREDDYSIDDVRRPSRSRTSERPSLSDRPRRPRSSRNSDLNLERPDRRDWSEDDLGDRANRTAPRPPIDEGDRSSRTRKSRPGSSAARRRTSSSDYVDYQPVDYSDDWS